MESHRPDLYIGGVYIPQTDVWCGEFGASSRELMRYAENDVTTIEEYDLILCMVMAQQTYMMWWERTLANK